MDRFTPIWFARVLGMTAFVVVLGMAGSRGDTPEEMLMLALGGLEPASGAMLGAALGGFVLGSWLKGIIESSEVVTDPATDQGLIDAELPGTMPPLSE